MSEKYEICEECGAVAHGNLFCNTCRNVMNTRNGWKLPAWNHPAEKPCGVEEVAAFIQKIEQANLQPNEILVGAYA